MSKKHTLTKQQQTERRLLIFQKMKERVDNAPFLTKGDILLFATELADEFGYTPKSVQSIYYDGLNNNLDKYKTKYKSSKISLHEFGSTVINICIENLKEEAEWIDEMELLYTITPIIGGMGFLVKGSFVSKINKIPVFVDDSKIPESYEHDFIYQDFIIPINNYKDTIVMYKRVKLELMAMVKEFQSNNP